MLFLRISISIIPLKYPSRILKTILLQVSAQLAPNIQTKWDRLLLQDTMTLNMLRTSLTNPKLPSYTAISGIHDFKRYNLAPPRYQINCAWKYWQPSVLLSSWHVWLVYWSIDRTLKMCTIFHARYIKWPQCVHNYLFFCCYPISKNWDRILPATINWRK